MTLLDRFRAQPRHRHPDPAVRLAYVEELRLDERDAILSIAREDDDPRVRRAAVAKLMDPVSLGPIARDDVDEAVRGQAVAMLRDIALDAFEGVGENESLDALDALSDGKTLAQIAKTAGREIVALRALSRIADGHMLGSIARHGTVEAARRGAFELLRERADHLEVLNVALNSEYRDTALLAVDVVNDHGDRGGLEQIAARGKNKSAAKRARMIIRETENRAAREAAEAVTASTVEPLLLPALEQPASAGDQPARRRSTETIDAEHAQAEEARRHHAQEEENRRQEAQAVAEARAQAASETRQREVLRRHGRLAELSAEAAAAAVDPDLSTARRRFAVVRREWRDLSSGIEVGPELAAQFAEADATFTARDSEAREADARARLDTLARLRNLLGRVEPLAVKADLTLREGDRALHELRIALGVMPPLPSKQDFDEMSRRLKAAQAALIPRVQELRDADDWQRWANAVVQEQLCVRMEALKAVEDPEAVAHHIRELQQQWRQAASVPRAQADALWRRFKAAHDEVWPRCEAHFAAQARERGENLARKIALCERAEALADSTRWIQTAEEIKRMQADWKTIGPVSRGREKFVWERFRAACDRFFTRRHADLVQRKSAWAENLAKKEVLCVRAEALADSSEWDQTAAEIRRLQSEWKTIGPIKKNRSEAIWQRFHGACNRFFTRYAQRHDISRAERVAAREAICAELEALVPSSPESQERAEARAPQEIVAAVRALRIRWQQEVAARGVDPDLARALDDRFAAAFARGLAHWSAAFAGTDLDLEANRKRMESIVRRMEDLATSLAGPANATSGAEEALSPTTRLAAMLKEALAANTIGGKIDEDSRLKAAAEELRQAQASWSRIGPVPDETRRVLADRFQRACRRIAERTGKAGEAGGGGRPGTGRAVEARSGETRRPGR